MSGVRLPRREICGEVAACSRNPADARPPKDVGDRSGQSGCPESAGFTRFRGNPYRNQPNAREHAENVHECWEGLSAESEG